MPAKPAAKAKGPSYQDMAKAAILALKDRGGSSLQASESPCTPLRNFRTLSYQAHSVYVAAVRPLTASPPAAPTQSRSTSSPTTVTARTTSSTLP